MHLFSCVFCTPKALYNHLGGGGVVSPQQPPASTASTWMMRRLPQDNGTSALTTLQVQVQRRGESHRANQVDDRKLENTVKQSQFRNLESFTRSELKLESVHQESPRSHLQEKGYQPLLKQKSSEASYLSKEKKNWTVAQWSKVLFSDESHFAFHLEIKVPESGGRVERHSIHVA